MTLKFKGQPYINLSIYCDAKLIPKSFPIPDGCGFNFISEEQNNKLNYIYVKNGMCNWRFWGQDGNLKWQQTLMNQTLKVITHFDWST